MEDRTIAKEVEVKLWKGSTMTKKIKIPNFVKVPDILIIKGKYYHRLKVSFETMTAEYEEVVAYEVP